MLSYLEARPSLEPKPLQVFIFYFFFFCPTDRPTITRDGAMENETFYGDGLNKSLYLTKLATRNNKINSPAQTILCKR